MTSYTDTDVDDADNPELLAADVARMRPGAEILPLAVVRGAVFEIYAHAPRDWRWTLRSADGRALAASTQGYASRQKALEIIEAVKNAGHVTPVLG